MPGLETLFDERVTSQENRVMLGNLALVIAAHDERPATAELPDPYAKQWSGSELAFGVTLDRVAEQLSSEFDVAPETLAEFVGNETVADVGCGKSNFLWAFPEAHRVAVDVRPEHVKFQERFGHTGVLASAHDMSMIPTASVRLLHASYSAPFWSETAAEARATGHEYVRVLAPNGMALVGPICRSDLHQHYEMVNQARVYGENILPWNDPDNAHMSRVWMAFAKTILNLQWQGDLEQGYVDVVGFRNYTSFDHDFRADSPGLHVPNYLMLRKVA